ncbi:hypothetical protein GCM10010211_85320 [Streptomyces albospinus]|uniref:Uncharacterized protein n=1 Tax=Streptomyces albospinus TaxID=285515 RepID=A0ABQ2VRS8_9ACTN|nr:hypothetical protein [Streptomyces albospinus]GGV05319.1 hypothetical protein GCM10010211_85320 [Streptomyces albospinus]
MELPAQAAPGVEVLAAAAADTACELADAAAAWNLTAAEDTADAIDTLAEALGAIDPEAARLLAANPAATKALLRHLGQDQDDNPDRPSPRPSRPLRRRLGHGWQGIRVPSADRGRLMCPNRRHRAHSVTAAGPMSSTRGTRYGRYNDARRGGFRWAIGSIGACWSASVSASAGQ